LIKKIFLPILLLITISCTNINVDKLIEEKKFEEAADVLESRYALSRDKGELNTLLIIYNNELNDITRAKELVMDYYKRNGGFSGIENIAGLVYYNYAQELYRQAKTDSVKYFLLNVLKLQPQNAKAYLLMGKAQMRTGSLKEGEVNIKLALQMDSTLSDAYVFLGNAKALQDDYKEAEKYYMHAVKLDSANYEAWMNLGIAKEYFKKTNDALEFYKKAISINPKRKDAYDYIIKVYSDRNLADSAFRYMEQYQNLTGEVVKYDRSYRQ